MINLSYKTRYDNFDKRKNRIYFTSHPEDFELYFNRICDDILSVSDVAIYYTDDMSERIDESELDTTLGQMSLFVVAVTKRLLYSENRAIEQDIQYARTHNIPILPIVMEEEIDSRFLMTYSKAGMFGEMQYISPTLDLESAVDYKLKLKSYLDSVIIGDEIVYRIQAAFDAYIFLSYRKKDRKYANELMRLIHSYPECRDIAIWYDEYLTPGESFKDNIERALSSSDLVTLLVTPSILEEQDGMPNYIMSEEYPRARELGKDIIAAEVRRTDHDELRRKFISIPECVDTSDTAAFKKRLIDSLHRAAIRENDNNPEHLFLIGLAYLEGIDVEMNKELGESLIERAANENLPEAIDKLFNITINKGGYGSAEKAEKLVISLIDVYRKEYGENHEKTIGAEKLYILVNMPEAMFINLSNRCVELCKKCESIFGKEHPETIEAYSLLASAYCKEQIYGKVIEVFEEMYPICAKVLGEDHNVSIRFLKKAAEAYEEIWAVGGKEDRERARNQYLLSTELISKNSDSALGRLHPNSLDALKEYYNVCYYTGYPKKSGRLTAEYHLRWCEANNLDPREAVKKLLEGGYRDNELKTSLYQSAYSICCKVEGKTSLLALNVLSDSLCKVYSSTLNYNKERHIRKYIIDVLSSRPDFGEMLMLRQKNSLVRIYTGLKDYSSAMEMLKELYSPLTEEVVLASLSEAFEGDTEAISEILESIGDSLLFYDRSEEGVGFHLCSHKLICDVFGTESYDGLLSLEKLHNAFVLAGRRDDAVRSTESALLETTNLPKSKFNFTSSATKLYKRVYDLALRLLGEENQATEKIKDTLLKYSIEEYEYASMYNGIRDSYKVASEIYALLKAKIADEFVSIIDAMFDDAGRLVDRYENEMAKRIEDTTMNGGVTFEDDDTSFAAKKLLENAMEICLSITGTEGPAYEYRVIDGVLYIMNRDNATLVYYPTSKSNAEFTLPDFAHYIKKCAFICNNYLRKVILSDKTTFLSEFSFEYCSELREVTVGKDFSSITQPAFDNCNKMERIIYKGTLDEWRENVERITSYRYNTRYIKLICLDDESTVAI